MSPAIDFENGGQRTLMLDPKRRSIAAGLALLGLAACTASPQLRPEGAGAPVVYPLPARPEPRPSRNWLLPPLLAEEVMRSCEIRAHYQWPAGGGVTGALKVALYSPRAGKPFLAKWKTIPRRFESWNNSPRREMAAYEVQKLFLDPEDYVVPPTVMRCADLDDYRLVIDEAAKPSFPEARCVLGSLSLWLDHVTVPDVLYDPARFATDANYAMRMADFNLLTYLIDHKDGRRGNFLVSKDDLDRRVFSVDNGISFDAWVWNYFVPNWNDLRVPALRKKSVDRLRAVTREQVEAFAVLAELRLMPDGHIESVAAGPPLDEHRGARVGDGVVQLGLTADEIDDVREQIEKVIEGVDAGEIPVF